MEIELALFGLFLYMLIVEEATWVAKETDRRTKGDRMMCLDLHRKVCFLLKMSAGRNCCCFWRKDGFLHEAESAQLAIGEKSKRPIVKEKSSSLVTGRTFQEPGICSENARNRQKANAIAKTPGVQTIKDVSERSTLSAQKIPEVPVVRSPIGGKEGLEEVSKRKFNANNDVSLRYYRSRKKRNPIHQSRIRKIVEGKV